MSGAAAAITAGINLGGSILAMYGSSMASKEKEAMAKYNAQVARDRGMAQMKAIRTQNQVQRDVDRGDMSTIENAMANSGVEAGVGSPLLVATAELADKFADRNETERQAKIAKIMGDNEAQHFEYQAMSMKKARHRSMIAQGIGAMTDAAGTYMNNKGGKGGGMASMAGSFGGKK